MWKIFGRNTNTAGARIKDETSPAQPTRSVAAGGAKYNVRPKQSTQKQHSARSDIGDDSVVRFFFPTTRFTSVAYD
jgi:hypothetical protein